MIVLFIFLGLAIAAGLVAGGVKTLELRGYKTLYGISQREVYTLSYASQRILKEYNALPAQNRPNGNMFAILSALDKKFGGDEEVDKHFRANRYDNYGHSSGTTFSWTHTRNECGTRYGVHHKCEYQQYNDIYDGLVGIAKDLADQAYQLEMAGIAGRLGEATSLLAAMDTERMLIRETTNSIKKDMGELE